MDFLEWLEEKKKEKVNIDYISDDDIECFINSVKSLIFPGYNEEFDDLAAYLDSKVLCIRKDLTKLLKSAQRLDGCSECAAMAPAVVETFLNELPHVDYLLKTDIKALYDGDPAASNKTEIILCYPGLKAIFVYRIAHVLYEIGVPMIPRILSEYAHSKTGIDIHPGAKIDESFFIDHGTGIVIGQTCEIGKRVKIYQGVTLGALSLKAGHSLEGSKRHPTILDDVTIYSGASIFGGDTVIGNNTTVGSNAFITSSVEDDMVVTIKGQKKKKNSQ